MGVAVLLVSRPTRSSDLLCTPVPTVAGEVFEVHLPHMHDFLYNALAAVLRSGNPWQDWIVAPDEEQVQDQGQPVKS